MQAASLLLAAVLGLVHADFQVEMGAVRVSPFPQLPHACHARWGNPTDERFVYCRSSTRRTPRAGVHDFPALRSPGPLRDPTVALSRSRADHCLPVQDGHGHCQLWCRKVRGNACVSVAAVKVQQPRLPA
jgi:hypothetical protein